MADAPLDDTGEGVAQRVTRWLWRTMIQPAHVVVDHHSVRRALKPYVFCEAPAIDWAVILGCAAVWCTGPMPETPTAYPYRRLCVQALRQGKVGLCIEYSRQHEICEADRHHGRFAVLNMMRALGMIEGDVQSPRDVWLIEGPYWEGLEQMRSPHVGHVHFDVDEYDWLTRGRRIATVRDLQTQAVLDEIRAPYDCLMLHRTPEPVHHGDRFVCRLQRRVRRLVAAGEPVHVPPWPGSCP